MTDKSKPFEIKPSAGYAGDVSVETAWSMLSAEPAAVLIDVRSTAEWSFVGVPDLSSLGKETALVEWQSFPSMAQNPSFLSTVKSVLAQRVGGVDAPVLFLCRSGARSRSAALALTAAGYTACYNVAGGFEGDLDRERHRGHVSGWKAAGLPWVQS